MGSNGVSPRRPAPATPPSGDIVREVAGSNVYKTTFDFLNQLHPDNVYFFNWDWRKGPVTVHRCAREQDRIRTSGSRKLEGRPYGARTVRGLLARLYLDNASRAEAISRVITIGTPAWGSPKAIFPVYAGIETPEFSPLDLLVDNDEAQGVHALRNLTGCVFPLPQRKLGSWLTVGAYPSPPLRDRQGVLNYVTELGGNAALLDQALTLHASTLDSPYVGPSSGPKFEIIVGTGLPTISSVQVLPGGYLKITYDNGDGTVPAKSAARGALGSGNPNKNHTYYSCGVDHVALPGHSQITDAIDDFLKYADEIEGLESPCGFGGSQFRSSICPR